MYLLGIYFRNAKRNCHGRFQVEKSGAGIKKWTLLPSGPCSLEQLQLMALACGGAPFVSHLPCKLGAFVGDIDPCLRLEFELAHHASCEGRCDLPMVFGSGLDINPTGRVTPILQRGSKLLPAKVPVRRPPLGHGNSAFFFVGYGWDLCPHDGTDDFDFENPYHRVTRFHSLFRKGARLTDPVAFLNRLHYRAVLKSRYPAKQTLLRLIRLLREHLGIETERWMERDCDFEVIWSRLAPRQQRMCLPILDAVRHVVDAFPKSGTPLDQPGVMLLDRPDVLCSAGVFSSWIEMVDRLFPSIQFVAALSARADAHFPHEVRSKLLTLPDAPPPPPVERAASRLRKGAILLIHVDGRLPNLALMKLSRYYKEQGRQVILEHRGRLMPGAEAVYASCVFTDGTTPKRIAELKRLYNDRLVLGGSGVDIRRRLPKEIEKLPADLTLYRELGDRAMGFLTRGCPFDCPFCIVPAKEGKVRQVSTLDDLLQGDRKKLILLDDNILSHPGAGGFLEEMVQRGLWVNFTQTLDIRLLDKEMAGLLRRVRCSNTGFTRRVYHFSLNDTNHLDTVETKYRLLRFGPSDNVEFICMYGYNTTLAEDVERFKFLKSLPGAYVFSQQYLPAPEGPLPELADFFDDRADERIDELVRVQFPQNMKSMEKYYRWVSKQYAMTFGKLHKDLVDTIFKYNNRHRKGRYMASLAGTRKGIVTP